MHRIGKRYTFDATHHLPGLPAGHMCGRLRGHTYTAEFILASESLVPLTIPLPRRGDEARR
jgi:6-pyruvoyltetrahydropterin/6-carboxytetrahydropterin synthase